MSRSDSSSVQGGCKSEPARIAKPSPDFPLTAHRAGYWCKKIRGTIHYFGPRFKPGDQASATAAADAALTEYNEQKEALHEGRKPREPSEGLTVKEAANLFLAHKEALRDSRELSNRTWQGYKFASDQVVATFGKGRLVSDLDPDDFAKLRNKMAQRLGLHGLGTFIQ